MKKFKLTAVVLIMVVLTGILAACGSSVIEKPTVGENVTKIEITGYCDMEVNGSTITITGETSFIPKTLIYVCVVSQSGAELSSEEVIQTEEGTINVTFEMTDDYYSDDVKTITGFITVAPKIHGKQDSDIYEQYGDKFERISNDTVWNKDGNIVNFASEPIEIN